MHPQAFFLPASGGQRFCLLHPAGVRKSCGSVVFAQPFAEETNKARRMVALQARALASQGYAVLLPDLQGCGDSSGDFAEARWEQWVGDLVLACEWMRARDPGPLWLWGLRSGCLLAAQAARQLPAPADLLLWAPTPTGRQTVQQFLRLAAASDLMSGNSKATMERLRRQIALGELVEIAGYTTSGALLQSMEQAAMLPDPRPGRMLCFDVSTQPGAGPSPATGKLIETWRAAGHAVVAETVQGPAFWQTTEIEEAGQLLAATTAAMASEAGAAGAAPVVLS